MILKYNDKNILIFGAGGIGCEVLKLLTLTHIELSNIFVIDCDTIELSNLNRQFFFTKNDISLWKSHTVCRKAARTLAYRSSSNINFVSIAGKIGAFSDISIVSSCSSLHKNSNIFKFIQPDDCAVIFNCLDNEAARSYVNKYACLFRIPLIDGGSEGWFGQSLAFNVIGSGLAGCYDCRPKKVDHEYIANHNYPVCSIRSRPTSFEHCLIFYASKNIKTIRKIYKLAIKRAKNFNIDVSMSLQQTSTFLEKIIPATSSTNSIIASLMVSSFFDFQKHGRDFYLIAAKHNQILPVHKRFRNANCNTCSIPAYIMDVVGCSNIWVYLTGTWNATEIFIDDNSFYSNKSWIDNNLLYWNFAIVIKNGLRNLFYFIENTSKEIENIENGFTITRKR